MPAATGSRERCWDLSEDLRYRRRKASSALLRAPKSPGESPWGRAGPKQGV